MLQMQEIWLHELWMSLKVKAKKYLFKMGSISTKSWLRFAAYMLMLCLGKYVHLSVWQMLICSSRQFAFHIEGLLQDFVWRWIEMTDANLVGWVENAVKQDS